MKKIEKNLRKVEEKKLKRCKKNWTKFEKNWEKLKNKLRKSWKKIEKIENKLRKFEEKTLPEAQQTPGIEIKTWMIFFSWNYFKLISVRKIIQVIGSIPWVRCASGNIFYIMQERITLF